jgi:hypothetical protein
MTLHELMQQLIGRDALIVHCSQPARHGGGQRYGGIGGDDLIFPNDLLNAIEAVGGTGELCCSVVWPDHLETYGSVGIVLRPRSTASIRSLSTVDAGSSWDESTGRRRTGGDPFSAQAVADTFANAAGYNEWTITDADCLGIFVHPTNPMQVATRVEPEKIDGYDPSAVAVGSTLVATTIDLDDVVRLFPGQPIFTFHNGRIVQMERGPVSPYHPAGEVAITDDAGDGATSGSGD